MIVTVEVTQEDIDLGEQGDCRFCPIALAIQRALPHLARVSVTYSSIFLDLPGGSTWRVLTPADAQRFITDFDDAWGVSPCGIDLDISDQVLHPRKEPNEDPRSTC